MFVKESHPSKSHIHRTYRAQLKLPKRFNQTLLSLSFLMMIILLPLYAYKVGTQQGYTDFEVYYRAAVRAKALMWEKIYNLTDGTSPFRYPPPLLLFFRALAELTRTQAKLTWFFLQFLWFLLGFLIIQKTLKQSYSLSLKPKLNQKSHLEPTGITCLACFFTLRLGLDCFTIGQISSLMFLGYCLALYGWVTQRPKLSASGLIIPALIKISPGFLYLLFFNSSQRKKVITWNLLFIFILSLIFFFWIPSYPATKLLFSSWLQIVASDSAYFDSSHYGSQSWKSVLLRLQKLGWISPLGGEILYTSLALLVCLGVLSFWTQRTPRSFLGRGLFFSIGLFIPIGLMPQTFKYSLTPLAIPVSFLLMFLNTRYIDRFTAFSLILGVLTISLPGKDIVGDPLFFWIQTYSLPFISIVFLGISTFRLAWIESKPSIMNRRLRKFYHLSRKTTKAWPTDPISSPWIKSSLIIFGHLGQLNTIERDDFYQNLSHFISLIPSTLSETLEIIIFMDPFSSKILSFSKACQALSSPKIQIKVLKSTQNRKEGQAAQEGFLAAQGQTLFFFPHVFLSEPSFYVMALELLNSGYDLVRGSDYPQSVSHLLPFALHRKAAEKIFALQIAQGFLFSTEMSLIAKAQNFRSQALPLSNLYRFKKNPRSFFHRIFQRRLLQLMQSMIELPKIWKRFQLGIYESNPRPQNITADDWGLSPGVNLGILKLAQLGIVRRVSLMANAPFLTEHLSDLCVLKSVQLGLHFNLTYGRPLGNLSPNSPLLKKSHNSTPQFISSPTQLLLRWMNPFTNQSHLIQEVHAELCQQLDYLVSIGVQIHYLDGHQHIHLLPGWISKMHR